MLNAVSDRTERFLIFLAGQLAVHPADREVRRALVTRSKHPNVAVTAIARELIAFMWAIAKEVPITT